MTPNHNLTYTQTPTAEGNIMGKSVRHRLWHKTCASPSLGVYLRVHVPWMWGRWQPGCRWAGRWHPGTAHSAAGSLERWAQGPLEGTGPVLQTWCCWLAVWSVRKLNNNPKKNQCMGRVIQGVLWGPTQDGEELICVSISVSYCSCSPTRTMNLQQKTILEMWMKWCILLSCSHDD